LERRRRHWRARWVHSSQTGRQAQPAGGRCNRGGCVAGGGLKASECGAGGGWVDSLLHGAVRRAYVLTQGHIDGGLANAAAGPTALAVHGRPVAASLVVVVVALGRGVLLQQQQQAREGWPPSVPSGG
jgi:hypothetical protein